MSFLAKIFIGGKEYRLLHCHYALNRDVSSNGKPASEPRGGSIQFEVESSQDNFFFEWMIDKFAHKNGSVKFYRHDQDATMKELQFKDAYLVSYSESIDAVGDSPMTLNLVISAREINMGGATHKNPWPDK